MTTISSTFTATGASAAIAIAPGESVALVLSGTWVGRVTLQRKVGGSAWANHLEFSANVSQSITAGPGGDTFRWKCSSFTSGTITYSLADSVVNVVPGLGTVARATETTFQIDVADINGGTVDSLAALSVRDTSAAYDVTIKATSTTPLTAARAVTLDVNDAALILRSSAATDITLPTTGTLATLAGAEDLTNKTLTAPAVVSPTISGTPVGKLTYDPGSVAINNLRVASDVVSAETVTIGADIYEVEIVNTDSTDNTAGGTFNNVTNPITILAATYPGCPTTVGSLLRVENEIMRITATGASLTLARGQSGTTIAAHADGLDIFEGDGIVAGIAVGLVTTLTPTAFTAALVDDINERGTEAITAVLIGVNEILLKADAVGAVTTACTETLGEANNGFRAANMAGGRAQGLSKLTIQKRVPVAVEVALDHMHFQFDFTPTLVQVFVVVTATPGLAVAWDGGVTISGGLVTVDNGAAVDWTASHTVTVIALA